MIPGKGAPILYDVLYYNDKLDKKSNIEKKM